MNTDIEADAQAVQRGLDDLLALNTHGELRSAVAHYLGLEGSTPFTGRLFDSFGDNPSDEFLADDLLACAFLDTPIKGKAVEELLLNHPKTYNNLLRAVDRDISIWNSDATATRESLDAAGELRRQLVAVPTIGWTRAHKLTARKRPKLHPVYDSVVSRWFHDVDGIRYGLHGLVVAGRSPKKRLDEELRPEGVELETLRILDIAVWMCGSRSGSAQHMRQALGISPPSSRVSWQATKASTKTEKRPAETP